MTERVNVSEVNPSVSGFTPVSLLRAIFGYRESGILLFLILFSVIAGIINPLYFSPENLVNIVRTTSFFLIMGIAMTFVLISGGLDLSIAPVFALAGLIAAMASTSGVPVLLSICLALAAGLAIGALNGFLIVRFSIPALIVTLGMLYMGRGVVLIITRGVPVHPLPDGLINLGQGDLLGIPYVTLIAFGLALLAHFVLNHTAYGRAIYATGGNEVTARLSGIDVDWTKQSVYILCSVAAALSGIIMAGRLNSGQPNIGAGYELIVIAAVIIGGTSLFGGSGTILGTVAGALLTTAISNGLVLMKVSAYWQNLVVGAIIILAVGLDQFRRRRSGLL